MIGPIHEALGSVSGTVRDTLVFTGRSRVRDVIYFGLVTSLIGIAVDAAIRNLFSWEAGVIAQTSFNALLTLPFLALFVRRLHDQDRTGWWVMMLLPLMALTAYDRLHTSFAIYDPNFMENVSRSEAWRWLLLPVGVALLAFAFLPGSIGTNRFGPDPREDAEGIAET